MKNGITAFISSALLAAGMTAAAAVAQTPAASAAPQQKAVPKQNISEAKLKQFVVASLELSDIATNANKELATQNEPAAQQKLRQDAEEKMAQVVKREGFSVDEFQGISQTVQSDPALRQRAQKIAESP